MCGGVQSSRVRVGRAQSTMSVEHYDCKVSTSFCQPFARVIFYWNQSKLQSTHEVERSEK